MNFAAFCERHDLQPNKTHQTLLLLERYGLFYMSQMPAYQTKVLVKANGAELNQYVTNKNLKTLTLQYILRSYSGVLEYQAAINPSAIAKNLSTSENKYNLLWSNSNKKV